MSNVDAQNDWELGSGLDLDGAKVEITKADFGMNNSIGAGVLCANFTFTPLEGGEDVEQSFSVGKNWEADRTGENLVPEDGRKRKLNMSSNFGILLSSAMDVLAGPQESGESDTDYRQRRIEVSAEVLGSPRHAPNWVGTMWEMGTVERDVVNPTTQAAKKGTRFVFVSWLGDGIGDGGTTEKEEPVEEKAKPAKAAGARKAAASRGSKPAIPTGIDADLWAALIDHAVEVQDRDEDNEHEDFVDSAMDLDGVNGNKAAQKAIMGTAAGSVWAAAKTAPREG